MGLSLSGCGVTSYVPNLITPYKYDIVQGNFITQEMVTQLKQGMTKDQVRFMLGTPLINDSFHTDRWDYVYRLKKGDGKLEFSRYQVTFKDNLLDSFGGSDLPTELSPEQVMAQKTLSDPTIPLTPASGSNTETINPDVKAAPPTPPVQLLQVQEPVTAPVVAEIKIPEPPVIVITPPSGQTTVESFPVFPTLSNEQPTVLVDPTYTPSQETAPKVAEKKETAKKPENKRVAKNKKEPPAPTTVTVLSAEPALESSLSQPESFRVIDQPVNKPAEQFNSSGATVLTEATGEVLRVVDDWAQAWSTKDVDSYLRAYVKDFKGNLANRQAWEAFRRQRISNPQNIQIQVLNAKVQVLSKNSARVNLEQRYESNILSEKGAKTLDLLKTDQGWKINKETFTLIK